MLRLGFVSLSLFFLVLVKFLAFYADCEGCELSRITFEVLVERSTSGADNRLLSTFIIYLLFTTHSYLCFEKSRSLSGKHIVIKLDAVTSLLKVKFGCHGYEDHFILCFLPFALL